MRILDFILFNLLEGKTDLKFIKQPKKESAKTETYKVIKDDIEIGLIKWSSRMRGYAFLPSDNCQDDVKIFIKNLMDKRRKEKK
jgi:hypothetical protein